MPRGTQFSRQWKILSLLASRRFGLTLEELAKELGCHARTVRRDVAVLDEVGFGPERGRDGDGRVLLKASPAMKVGMPLSLPEALAVYFAGDALRSLRGTPVQEGLESVLRKIESALPVHALDRLEAARSGWRAREGPRKDYKSFAGVVAALQRGAEEGRKVALEHKSLGRERAERHVVRPYGLVWSGGSLYAIGWSELRGAVRTFLVDRVERAALLADRFERPEGFDPGEYLGGSFGMYREDASYPVEVDFSPKVARYIREREWHPTQRLKDLPGGGVRLSMEVCSLVEVESWVLSFGSEARVKAPATLADRVSRSLQRAAKLYADRGTTRIAKLIQM